MVTEEEEFKIPLAEVVMEDEIISINISPARGGAAKKEKSREELISNLHKALSEL